MCNDRSRPVLTTIYMPDTTPTLKDMQVPQSPDWCPGCGDFGILMAIKKAIVGLGRPIEETCLISGIGCSGKLNHYVNTYGFESLHGRALPVATGVHLSNHDLNTVIVGGDGDGYGIGMGHLFHTMRRNLNMTYVIHNNQVYGLTKGQYSPTTECGMKTASSPYGALETPVNPVHTALAAGGATFIARGFAGDIKYLTELILAGMNHKGFALIDVLQPCVTFNKLNTYDFFRQRVYKLQEDETFDNTNKQQAWERADEWDQRIATGIFYQVEDSTYKEHLPALKDTTLLKQQQAITSPVDISKTVAEYI